MCLVSSKLNYHMTYITCVICQSACLENVVQSAGQFVSATVCLRYCKTALQASMQKKDPLVCRAVLFSLVLEIDGARDRWCLRLLCRRDFNAKQAIVSELSGTVSKFTEKAGNINMAS